MTNSDTPDRAILPTLILGVSSIDPPNLIVGMSLIEIALSFGISVSLAGQIRSITSILAIVVALTMGVLSLRYDYKSLLMAGLVINIISSILCAFAPSFILMLLCFSIMGLVTSLVTPMVFSYIGEIYRNEERSQVVGTVASVRTISYLVMVQLIGVILAVFGWRYAFLLLVVPLTLLALVFSYRVLPGMRTTSKRSDNVFEGYGSVFRSKSALSCLLGNMLAGGAWAGGIVTYSVTYLREDFILSISSASRIFSGLVIGVLVGNYFGGIIAKKVGCKKLIVVSSTSTGLLIFLYMSLANIFYVIIICGFMSLTAGIVLTCANTLILEQVPQYRGTVTSLNSATTQLGIALGAAFGGLVLSLSNWETVGITYGVMQLAAALIYQIGVKEIEV